MTAGLGGLPTKKVDVPITAVFMALFVLAAVGHITIFQRNKAGGHRFYLSGALFGFCMARILACILRISWACEPTKVSVAITASLFFNLGDLVGFIINLNFAQRVIRALNPRVGWHPASKIFFAIIYCVIGISIGLLIGFTVDSIYTLDPKRLRRSRDILLYGSTYFAFTAFLPIPLVLLAMILPRKTQPEAFGAHSLRTKIITLLSGATVLALGAWFRAGTNYLKPRPVAHPGPYQSRACFYIFYFTLEILVIWGYLLARVDLMFHVPDGSKGPGDYARTIVQEKDEETGQEEEGPGTATDDGEKDGHGTNEESSTPPATMLDDESKDQDGKHDLAEADAGAKQPHVEPTGTNEHCASCGKSL